MRRRQFLAQGCSWASLASLASRDLLFAGEVTNAPGPDSAFRSGLDAGASRRSLVIIELEGGNDSLNTLAPRKDPRYAAARPQLHIPSSRLLSANEELGFHPAFRPLMKHFEAGRVAALSQVGYAPPDRSHFRSMDIWQSGVLGREETRSGWIGRALARSALAKSESLRAAAKRPMFSVGRGRAPLALSGGVAAPIALSRLEDLRLRGGAAQAQRIEELLRRQKKSSDGARNRKSEGKELVLRASEASLAIGRGLEATRKRLEKSEDLYPKTPFGRELRLVAALMRSGFSNGVYTLRLPGFDTHARQEETHPVLLAVYAKALAAFLDEMATAKLLDDCLVLTFSEFGRRVRENGTKGTDHGAGGALFLAGGKKLRAGVHGELDLEGLVDGDLAPRVDFREVYRRLEEDWLGLASLTNRPRREAPRFLL